MLRCAAADPAASVLQRLAAYIECQGATAGKAGVWAVQQGPIAPALLTACLTIYVGLIGYQMILGDRYDLRRLVIAASRAGAVIAFSSAWGGYQPVIQQTVVEGPSQLAGALLAPAGLAPAAPVALVERMQLDYHRLRAGPQPVPSFAAPPGARPPGAPVPNQTSRAEAADAAAPPDAPAAPVQLPTDLPGLTFLLSSVGVYLAVRLAAGLLLSLGPLVLPFALFDQTLGLLEGWVRALLGCLLSASGAMVVAGFELDFVEREITRSLVEPGAPLTEQGLGLTAVVFAAVTWAVLAALLMVARGLRLRWNLGAPLERPRDAAGGRSEGPVSLSVQAPTLLRSSRSHAVAEAVSSLGRRAGAAGVGSDGGRPAFPAALAAIVGRQRDGGASASDLGERSMAGRRPPLAATRSPVAARREERR